MEDKERMQRMEESLKAIAVLAGLGMEDGISQELGRSCMRQIKERAMEAMHEGDPVITEGRE